MTEMEERIARALAECHGDNWEDIPEDKSHWTEMRGQFNGRFRDVNERYRCDYLDEARAALEAMREPTAAMLEKGGDMGGYSAYEMVDGTLDIWHGMIDAALNEKTPTAS